MKDHFFKNITEEVDNSINIDLLPEQKEIVHRVMEMLADANICLCNDYESSGELCAFNSKGGKVYACSKDEYNYEYTLLNEDEVDGELYHIPSTYKDKQIYSFFGGSFAVKK